MQSFPDDKGATARPAPQHTSNFAEPVPSRLGILLAGLMLDVLHHDRACSYPGLSSHSIGLLQVLNNLRSFKHGHTSIGILNVRNLENIPFVYQLLPFRAVAGN